MIHQITPIKTDSPKRPNGLIMSENNNNPQAVKPDGTFGINECTCRCKNAISLFYEMHNSRACWEGAMCFFVTALALTTRVARECAHARFKSTCHNTARCSNKFNVLDAY